MLCCYRLFVSPFWQVSRFKNQLQLQTEAAADELEKARRDAQAQMRKLQQDIDKAGSGHDKQLKQLEDSYKLKIKQLMDNKDRETSVSHS